MLVKNIIKIIMNIGYIIYYKTYNSILHLVDVELPIPSLFNPIGISSEVQLSEVQLSGAEPSEVQLSGAELAEHETELYTPYCETP